MTSRLKSLAAALAVLCLAPRPLAAAAAGSSDAAAGPDISFSLAACPSSPGPQPFRPSGRPSSAPQVALVVAGPGPAFPADGSGPRPHPRVARAWIEWAGFLTGSTTQYWLSNSFPEDADFKLRLDDQIVRIFFLEGVKFDSNQFSLNWSHVLGGALYYQFGRTNHLSWPYASLMSFLGSTWWEVIGEPKEVISINDMIITGLGGVPLGESWYQVSQFLFHQPAWLERALAWFNPVLRVNRWFDRKDPAIRAYAQPGWHDFSLFAGARRLSSGGTVAGTDLYLGLQTQMILLPEYGQPGEVHRRLTDTYVSELGFDIALQDGHAQETRWAAKVVPWGWLDQKIDADGKGYSLTFGIGTGFEFFKKRPLADYDAVPVPVRSDLSRLHLDQPRAFTDKLGIMHIAGPVLDWTVFRPGLRLRTVVEAYGDFGLINATALNDYSVSHPITGLWTTVFWYGYFYGFGGSGAASVGLDYKGFELRGRAEFGAWHSADFLDRWQGSITNPTPLVDTRTLLRGGLGWTIPRTPLKIFADLEHVRRWGKLEEVRATRIETKVYAGLAFLF